MTDRPAMNVVRLDRHVVWRVVILTLLLAWPLIVFGRPTYFSDSVSYYKGGKAAVELAERKIASLFRAPQSQPTTATTSGVKPQGGSAEESRGARSIPYSVAAYLLSAPDGKMIALALTQAMVVALTITIVTMLLGVIEPWKFVLLAITLVVATPVACFVNFAGSDIFAGVAICIFSIFATELNRLSGGVCLALTLVGAFAVASHPSHPPLAAGMFTLGLISIVLAQPRMGSRSRFVGWLLAPLALGLVATILAGLIGFGEVSMAPKRFPFALARSVEDGPARWYLEQNCATHHYAVCEVFGNDFPSNVGDFLWHEHGLRYRASPEQMDRIRAEESEILLRAVEAYPYAQANRTFRSIWRQLLHFGLAGTYFNQSLALDAERTPHLESVPDAHGWVLNVVETLSILSTLLCIGWIFWPVRVLRDARTLLLLVIAGILGNAVICAAFSGVDDRYGARVIWILPTVCIALMLGRRNVPAITGATATGTPAVTEPAAPEWSAQPAVIARQRPL